jgi:hypothetical protein
MNYKGHLTCGPWRQIGKAVICACGALLYHGKLPKDREAYAAALDDLALVVRRKIEEGDVKPGDVVGRINEPDRKRTS